MELSSNGFGSVHVDCMPPDFGLSPIEPKRSMDGLANAIPKVQINKTIPYSKDQSRNSNSHA